MACTPEESEAAREGGDRENEMERERNMEREREKLCGAAVFGE